MYISIKPQIGQYIYTRSIFKVEPICTKFRNERIRTTLSVKLKFKPILFIFNGDRL